MSVSNSSGLGALGAAGWTTTSASSLPTQKAAVGVGLGHVGAFGLGDVGSFGVGSASLGDLPGFNDDDIDMNVKFNSLLFDD